MSADPAAPRLEPCPHCGADHDETALRCPATDMVLPFQGRLLAGKFRFVAELGRGGMGAVWQARNIHVDRDVALKLILPEVSKNREIVARFQNEARVAARIGHAGICDILDLEITSLGPVIVMELLRGENLGQRIAREGRLPVHVAVGLVREALIALDAAHRAGIIHRDLKPENLFLHQPDADTVVVKLMDFGISKFLDGTGGLTAQHAIMGTPEYMAPEQVGGAVHADARTDIWAIGAVLYRALTGVDAFAGATFPATVLAIMTTEPAPLESHAGALPPGLSEVVLRCLSKKPDDRYQSARELADALRPFERPTGRAADRALLGSLPTVQLGAARPTILAPPGPARAKSRWPRALVTLALLAAAGFGAWSYATGGAAYPDLMAMATPTKPPTLPEVPALQDTSERTAPEPAVPPGPTTGPTAPALDPAATAEVPALTGTTGPAAEPPATDTTGPAVEPPATTAAPDAGAAAPPAEEPPPLIVAGNQVTPAAPGKAGNQHWAKEYCAALDRNKYLGIDTWKLANPSEARRFAGVAGIRPGGYWTTATHRGRGLVVWLPRGTDSSVRVTTKAARPLCIAPKP